MHLYTNITCKIYHKLKNILKIYITILFFIYEYTYKNISIHIIDIHLMSDKKTKTEFLTQYDI